MNLGILAGEASGDTLGHGLITELNKQNSGMQISGIGGPKMISEGCDSLFLMERLSIMGFFEPLKRLRELVKMRFQLAKHFLENKPDVFVGIDSPDFNLGLELKLKKAGIPTVHYVSPSVWAWRQKRIHKIARATDLVLTLLPFELDFYNKHGVPARFVGHPLADLIPLEIDTNKARDSLNIKHDEQYIALLPGSRLSELKHMGEMFIKTAKLCFKENNKIKFITSSINVDHSLELKKLLDELAPELPVNFYVGKSHEVMAAADAVLVTSGTATLETMLYKKPMVVVFKMGGVTFEIAKRIIKVKHIALPNLLADAPLVPELIQDQAEPNIAANYLLEYLSDKEKTQELKNKFYDMHSKLRCNASFQAAKAVMDICNK